VPVARCSSCHLMLKDVLIGAPYNAQVSALSRRLGANARLGAVDKFQGQETLGVWISKSKPIEVFQLFVPSLMVRPRLWNFITA
jgi:hypothetical protein